MEDKYMYLIIAVCLLFVIPVIKLLGWLLSKIIRVNPIHDKNYYDKINRENNNGGETPYGEVTYLKRSYCYTKDSKGL